MLSRRKVLHCLTGGAALGGAALAQGAFAQDQPQREAPRWVTPAVIAPGLEQIVFASRAARTDVSFHVLSPSASVDLPENRFPTLYWLHGTNGATASIRPMATLFAQAMRAGQMPSAFVIFPNGLRDNLWCDSLDGSAPVETVLMQEIIPLVDARFRTIADRSGRVIEGFSMGGFGAGRLGFRYPDLFSGVSMLGAGPLQEEFTPESVAPGNRSLQADLFARVFGSDQSYFRAESPRGLAAADPARLQSGLRLRLAIGADDFSLPANRDFSAFLTSLAIPHALMVVEGVGHNAPRLLGALGFSFHRSALQG